MSSEQPPKKKRGRPRKNPTADPQPDRWQDRVLLAHGQSLGPVNRLTTGTLGQRDVESYDVLDALGQIVGKVLLSASTSLKPPHKMSCSMVQTDTAGSVIVKHVWGS
jgi:hypothetical protein